MANGGVRIIDRISHIFKMAQGEFIAPDKISNIYNQFELIAECFIHGEPSKDFLVGVVVPHETEFMRIANEEFGLSGSFEQLC